MPELTPDVLMMGFLWYVAFLFSTTCHEAAHALVAKIGGDETAALGGQVTLNPVPHIRREPFGMVLIPILSFLFSHSMIGWASAPFDPSWQRRYPQRAAWMALAGPAANFTLMTIAGIALRVGLLHGWFPEEARTPGFAGLAYLALWVFFTLNLFLGAFNLVPVPPLDGSTAITLFMPQKTALRYLDWLHESNLRMLGLVAAVVLFRSLFDYISFAARAVFFHGL